MIRYLIQVFISLGLLYWGYIQLYPIEMVEYRFVEQYLGNWYIAPVLARLLIATNWIIAVLLILNIASKKWPSILLLGLVVLHVYNIVWQTLSDDIIISESYSDMVSEHRWVSYLMLIIMLLFATYLWRREKMSDLPIKWLKYPLLIATLVLPFILNAIFPEDLADNTPILNETFPNEIPNSPKLKKLTESNVLVCFYSTSCPFCVRAAKKIAVAQKRFPHFPDIFVLFQGDEDGADYFLKTANVRFNYKVLPIEDYTKMVELTFPRFQLVQQGIIVRKWDGQSFNFSVMNKLSNERRY